MSKKQYNKAILALEIENRPRRQELEVPTDEGADDRDLYVRIDQYVAKNFEYDGIQQLLSANALPYLNEKLTNERILNREGMEITDIERVY